MIQKERERKMPSRYTDKEVQKMIDIYTENPCIETVERLMTVLNKPKKSIIAKLVKEGVYVTRSYRTKTGELPITKLELVRSIEDALDLSLPGLDKAPKGTLKKLSETIIEVEQYLDKALEELQQSVERVKTMEEMLGVKKNRNVDNDVHDPISILGEDS